jgi:hypothetical protein
MKRLLLFVLLALVPTPSAALADGCPLPCSGQTASPEGSNLLFVQPSGPGGPLVVWDTASRAPAFSLPPGRASADGLGYYTAAVRGRATRVVHYYAPTAERMESWSVPGRWRLEGVSPTGRWLALVRRNGRLTSARIFDAGRGRLAHVLRLRGEFEIEAISRDGKRLFLIEHLEGRRYNVRQYDLSRERLVVHPLRAAGVKIMAGYAWSGVGSPDGKWLLTLYLSTARNTAFVHSLDLERSRPACIELPSGGGRFELLKRYSLTLAPNGERLYAANAALGVVAELDLTASRVKRTTRFTASAGGSADRVATLSTISRNGRTLYYSSGRDLWAYDAAYSRVRGPYRTHGRVIGVGYGAGDRELLVVRRDGQMLAFNAATGKRLRY